MKVLCSTKCGFEIFVSRERNVITFILRTLHSKHTCNRVFWNKNAKSKWVAKQLIEPLKSNPKMTIMQVIDDIKNRYVVCITSSVVDQG